MTIDRTPWPGDRQHRDDRRAGRQRGPQPDAPGAADVAPAAVNDDAYIIETSDEAAGLVLRQRGGWRFVASDARYGALEGRIFRDPAAAERAAREIARRPG